MSLVMMLVDVISKICQINETCVNIWKICKAQYICCWITDYSKTQWFKTRKFIIFWFLWVKNLGVTFVGGSKFAHSPTVAVKMSVSWGCSPLKAWLELQYLLPGWYAPMAVGRRVGISPHVRFHRTLSIPTTWQLASPGHPRSREQDKASMSFMIYPHKSHSVPLPHSIL